MPLEAVLSEACARKRAVQSLMPFPQVVPYDPICGSYDTGCVELCDAIKIHTGHWDNEESEEQCNEMLEQIAEQVKHHKVRILVMAQWYCRLCYFMIWPMQKMQRS